MGKGGIPDRWLPYSPMGSVIPGTRFIACKVPLKEGLLRTLPEKERFGPKDLLEAFPKIGLLVDLTNTTRYYLKQDFTEKDVQYEKIFCPGKVVPPNSIVKQFFRVVDGYLAAEEDPDGVIVVHCTHGVNRTGYFICRYMIEKLNMSPEEALTNFQKARGHRIERETYVSDLQNGCKGGKESDLYSFSNGSYGNHNRRDDRRQVANSRRGFHGTSSDRNEGDSRKRRRQDSRTSNDYYSHSKWGDEKQRQEYVINSGGQRKIEEDRYSYNWRNHGNKNPAFPQTTPLPQFTPANHQGRPIPHQSPKLQKRREYPQMPSFGGAREHFKGPPSNGFKEPTRKGFSPLPKFCHPETPSEAAISWRRVEDRISVPEDTHYLPGGNQLDESEFKGHFRSKGSSRSRGSGRGRGRGRGSFNRGGSASRSRGKGDHRKNFS